MEKTSISPRNLEVLALKRLILDLVEWSGLPKKEEAQGWLCRGLAGRVEEALDDLPRNRSQAERAGNRH